jgi:hypothetical protein
MVSPGLRRATHIGTHACSVADGVTLVEMGGWLGSEIGRPLGEWLRTRLRRRRDERGLPPLPDIDRIRRRGQPEFGCDYCADEQNRTYGHVTQIGHSDETGSLLLRCPRCSTLYEVTEGVGSRTTRLSVEDAKRRFPGLP